MQRAARLCFIFAAIIAALSLWQTSFGPAIVDLGAFRLPANKNAGMWLVALLFALTGGVAAKATRKPLFWACVLLTLFLANTRRIAATDTVPNSFVPFALVQHRTLSLDDYPEAAHAFARPQPCVIERDGHRLSCAAIMVALLALPVFAPATLLSSPSDAHRALLEKLSAALLTVVSVMWMWQVFIALLPPRDAFCVSALYVLATSVLSIASQALWQHTGVVFGFSLALWALFTGRSALLIGVGCGIAVCSRQFAALALPGFLWAIAAQRGWRALVLTSLGGAPFALFLAWYNAHYFGSALVTGYGADVGDYFVLSAERLFGFWFSPGRGLLVYCPLVLLALWGLRREAGLLGAAVIPLVALSTWIWWGGPYNAGPRLWTDVVPFIGVGFARAWPELRARRAWQSAALYTVAMHLMLTYVAPSERAKAIHMNVEAGAWTWRSYAPVTFLHLESRSD